MYDTHVHSTFSNDGKSGLEEYARYLDENAIEGIGFTEHVDFMPECGSYGLFDYHAYIEAIESYRKKGYLFYAGAEIDYAYKVRQDIAEHLEQHKYDYTICSVHMINGISISDGRSTGCFRDAAVLRDMLERYYFEAASCIQTEAFDVIGHMNIYKRYITEDYFKDSGLKAWSHEMEEELARACAASGKILEVNTSGLFAPAAATFPDAGFLKSYYGYGGRMVSMGSDAHQALHICRGFSQARELLKDLAFKYLFLPWNKERPEKIV